MRQLRNLPPMVSPAALWAWVALTEQQMARKRAEGRRTRWLISTNLTGGGDGRPFAPPWHVTIFY